MVLHGRLDADVIAGRQILCGDEMIRQQRFGSELLAEATQRIVGHLFLECGAVSQQHFARVAQRKYRLDAAGDVVGEQGDRAGRGDRGEQRIADAAGGDPAPDIVGQGAYCLARKVGLPVEQREAPFSTAKSQEVR